MKILSQALKAEPPGEEQKKVINIDSKRSGATDHKNRSGPCDVGLLHEDGACLGQEMVEKKSNEVTGISKVLAQIQVKSVITIDTMGT